MKHNTVTMMVLSTLLFFAIFYAVSYKKRLNSLEKNKIIETAKVDFFKRFDSQNATTGKAYVKDSIHVNDDTLFFYRNDSFVGKTVIQNK